MDPRNLFETRTTYRLLRLEYLAALGLCTTLFITHWQEVRLIPALILFAYIDVIGYLPGLIAFHRSRSGKIHRGFYVAYNLAHSFVTAGLVAFLWAWLVRPEWALLAIPIHLCGDRGLLGNFLKPFAVSFEPSPHPAYIRLAAAVSGRTT
ncbi:hypothetical protein [Crossiella cryophila]|uniref:Integral membrane protein n=1 Tax=Crossiella cryophila TaxID=43355 RepID=A0A7W7CK63_9PSEU|nr:hypothetical protein [Crossiella cryophila]MBB4681301.1 hypothetical protein [Crossiella cryophila]